MMATTKGKRSYEERSSDPAAQGNADPGGSIKELVQPFLRLKEMEPLGIGGAGMCCNCVAWVRRVN